MFVHFNMRLFDAYFDYIFLLKLTNCIYLEIDYEFLCLVGDTKSSVQSLRSSKFTLVNCDIVFELWNCIVILTIRLKKYKIIWTENFLCKFYFHLVRMTSPSPVACTI